MTMTDAPVSTATWTAGNAEIESCIITHRRGSALAAAHRQLPEDFAVGWVV